jgi:hypothetical protein
MKEKAEYKDAFKPYHDLEAAETDFKTKKME